MSAPDYERTDASVRLPVWTAAALLILLPLAMGGVWVLLVTVRGAPETPAAVFTEDRPRPAAGPPLQADPQADLAALRARWDRRLNGYGWVDREAGIVHIPIERAMARVAEGERRVEGSR